MRWWDGSRWLDVFLVSGSVTTLERMRRNGRNIIMAFAGLTALWLVSMAIAAATVGPALAWKFVPMAVVYIIGIAIMSALFRRQIHRVQAPPAPNP